MKLQKFCMDNAQQASEDSGFLSRVFGRCSFVNVFAIHFPTCGRRKHIERIKYITGPLKIDELRITGTYKPDDKDR